eukprot:scaffold843_cov330-Pavlova_lutheri.AAC.39
MHRLGVLCQIRARGCVGVVMFGDFFNKSFVKTLFPAVNIVFTGSSFQGTNTAGHYIPCLVVNSVQTWGEFPDGCDGHA